MPKPTGQWIQNGFTNELRESIQLPSMMNVAIVGGALFHFELLLCGKPPCTYNGWITGYVNL